MIRSTVGLPPRPGWARYDRKPYEGQFVESLRMTGLKTKGALAASLKSLT